MQNMQAIDTATTGRKTSVVIRVSPVLAQEFYRWSRSEGRSGNAQGEILIREFVAGKQAEHASTEAEAA